VSYASENELKNSNSTQSATIDFKRVLFRAIRNWYVIVLSLAICMGIAYYKNRYSVKIYPVATSIIIRETEETGGGELIYKNALSDPYRNFLNEPYIIRSYPLIEQVVKDLNFDVSFFQQGYILTTEAYQSLPVKIHRLGNIRYDSDFLYTIRDGKTFSLRNYAHKEEEQKLFHFGDTIAWGEQRFVIEATSQEKLVPFISLPFLMRMRDPADVARGYVGGLTVTWAEEGSSVINLSVKGAIPSKEIDFLNGLVSRYQQTDLDKKNQTAERTIEFIEQQLHLISDSLKIFESQLLRFKNNTSTTSLTEESKRLFLKIEAYDAQKTELLIRQNYYKYLEDYIKKSENLDQIILPSSVGLTDAVISNLIARMIDLQLDIKLYVGRENQNPLVQEKIDRINNIKLDLLESMKSLKNTDEIKLSFLNAQIKKIEQSMESMPVTEQKLASIHRNYSLQENLYVFLMQKMSEASISKASNTSDVIMVNPPMQGGFIYPNTSLNTNFAFALGLLIPFGLFVLLELINNKVQSKEDIERISTIPFVGGIGHKKSDNNLEVLSSPKSYIAESFRALRSNLNFFIGQQNGGVFLITSSISGEGKTFTSVNLASIFSLSGKKTLIVGADMRKPKIYQDFQLGNEKGLSTYLSGIDSFDAVVKHTSFELLDLVSGGPVPPNPSELLLNDEMRKFMTEAKLRYDFIIIDTPPLAIVSDAFVLTHYADHTLFLVRQNYTPRSLVKLAHDMFMSGKLKNISIILNDIYRTGPGYGSYGYNYYSYGYGKRKNGYGYYTE
jgi:capsular exopolysaccharide synthesis family protein